MQRVTLLESKTDEVRDKFQLYDREIKTKLRQGTSIDPDQASIRGYLESLYHGDPAFAEEFLRAINNTDVNDVDVSNHNVDYLKFIDSLVMIKRGEHFKERVTVKKRIHFSDIELSV